jgi:hypothetical protein
MNSKQIKTLCGGRKMPNKPGTQGMDNKEMMEYIKKYVPKGTPLRDEFDRQTKKTRPFLCDFMGRFPEGIELLMKANNSKPAATKPSANNDPFAAAKKARSPPKKKAAAAAPPKNGGINRANMSWADMVEENLMGEEGVVDPNTLNNNNGGQYVGNSNNEGNRVVRLGSLANRGYRSRKTEKDPLGNKTVLSGRMKGRVGRKLRAAQASGKSYGEVLKNAMLVTPKQMRKRAGPGGSCKVCNEVNANGRKKFPSLKMMKMNGGNARVQTKASMPRPLGGGGRGLTKFQIRDARNAASAIVDAMNNATVGASKELLANIARARNGAASAEFVERVNKEIKKLREQKRNAIMKNITLTMTPPKPGSPPKPSFTMSRAVQNTLANKAAIAKGKKAANRTSANRKVMSLAAKMKIQANKTKKKEPAVRMMTGATNLLGNSNNNGSNRENNMVPNEPAVSNQNRLNKIVAQLEANRTAKVAANARGPVRARVRSPKQKKAVEPAAENGNMNRKMRVYQTMLENLKARGSSA